MPTSQYGTNYSQWFSPRPGESVPFPNPTTDAQRVENARARAKAAGVDIGSGYLNPKSGTLENPDSGFMTYIAEHPWLGAAIALAPAVPFALAGGPAGAGGAAAAGGTSSVIPGTGIPVASGTAGGLGALMPTPAAAAGAGAGGAAGAGGTAAATSGRSLLQKLLKSDTLTSLTPLIAALASRGGSGTSGIDTAALARQQQITETQMRRADPLHQAVTQLAYQRLPISARAGTTYDVMPLPR